MTPYHRDDGTIINPRDYPIPKLCLRCKLLGNIHEEICCTLNRIDLEKDEEFKCYAFIDIGRKLNGFSYCLRLVQYRIKLFFLPRWAK
ncbi:MAG: hypothetical protein J7L40_03780 [Candidatus Marinimicrobia bacterium]|nr:hypothetical protein [Candidatus Neomarinimicrobiota bacterium]